MPQPLGNTHTPFMSSTALPTLASPQPVSSTSPPRYAHLLASHPSLAHPPLRSRPVAPPPGYFHYQHGVTGQSHNPSPMSSNQQFLRATQPMIIPSLGLGSKRSFKEDY
jgi:hypothetical protein